MVFAESFRVFGHVGGDAVGHSTRSTYVPVNPVLLLVMLAIVYLCTPTATRADCSPDGTCSFDLWATQVQEEGNAWTNEVLATGPSATSTCTAGCANLVALNATAGDLTRLNATAFNHFDLPFGHRVTLVRVNSLIRYNNGVTGSARLSVVVPGYDTYAPACASVNTTDNTCECLFGGSNAARDITDTFPFRQNPELINQITLRIRRCGSGDPANLRVDAFRIHVETEGIPCPSSCPANLRGNGFCNCACNRPECNFDDGDCTDACSQQGCCYEMLGNGACDVQCDSAACGYDGNDCCENHTFCDAASFNGSIGGLYGVYGVDYDSLGQLTVETWIHVDGYGTNHGEPLRYVGANGSPWQISVNDANDLQVDLTFTVRSVSAVATKVLTRGLDAPWYHVAGTYDGATIRLYVNGQVVASASQSAGIPTAGANPELQLSVKMDCEMDEIRVWKVARSQDQIRCYMTQPVTPLNPDLMFDYWDCSQSNHCGAEFCPSYDSLIAPHNAFYDAEQVTSGATFGIPTAVTLDTLIADNYFCQGQAATMSVTSSGGPMLWYQWYKNGFLMPDAPGGVRTIFNSLQIPNAAVGDSGTYQCIVSDGCNQATATRYLHITSFADCMTGPIGDVSGICGCFDTDGDGDVDLKDFAAFQIGFGAPQ